jgi:hypothetical protein
MRMTAPDAVSLAYRRQEKLTALRRERAAR